MKIQQYKEQFSKLNTEKLNERLKDCREFIDFLESIYITGGANNFYSKEFSDAAYKERQQFCEISSAIHSLLRERETATV